MLVPSLHEIDKLYTILPEHTTDTCNIKSVPVILNVCSYTWERNGVKGAMGGISVILVKNHFFILLNSFDLLTIIYDSLNFQTSITVLQSFIRPYVNFCAI